MPLGNKPPEKTPPPPNVHIEEGQGFFAYKEQGVLKIVMTDRINGKLSEQNGVQTISVSIGK
jgi:hypothetical protein